MYRANVFVSYARADIDGLRLLLNHLEPLVEDNLIKVWY